MLDQLGLLIEGLFKCLPRIYHLRVTHAGVKIRGKKAKELRPGVHLFWPVVTEIIETPRTRQSVDLATQHLTTKDGATLMVSGVAVYELEDGLVALTGNHDVDDTIADVGRTAIVEVLARRAKSQVLKEVASGELAKTLTRLTRKRLRSYGARIAYCGLTDCCEAVWVKGLEFGAG